MHSLAAPAFLEFVVLWAYMFEVLGCRAATVHKCVCVSQTCSYCLAVCMQSLAADMPLIESMFLLRLKCLHSLVAIHMPICRGIHDRLL